MQKRFANPAGRALAAAAFGGLSSAAFAAAFAPNNVVVLRVGDGTAALASQTAAPVFLDEYTTAGTLVQTVAMPTTTSSPNFRLTLHGLETAVGALNLSADRQYLTLGGYDAAVGTTSLTGTAPGTTPRVIARVDASGTVDTSTTVTDGFARFASVVTDDGTRFWGTGNTNGVVAVGGLRHVASLGATTSTLVSAASPTAPNNLLMAGIHGGQLYTSASFGSPNFIFGVAAVGTGLPTTSGQSVAQLSGFPTSGTHAARAYIFTDADTIFLTDTGTTANGGGLQKWTQSAGTWTQAGSPFPYASPTTSNGLGGVAGTYGGGTIVLYTTTVETSANSLVKWVSTDGGASFASTVIATAPAGTFSTLFRGVAMTPGSTLPVELDGFDVE